MLLAQNRSFITLFYPNCGGFCSRPCVKNYLIVHIFGGLCANFAQFHLPSLYKYPGLLHFSYNIFPSYALAVLIVTYLVHYIRL